MGEPQRTNGARLFWLILSAFIFLVSWSNFWAVSPFAQEAQDPIDMPWTYPALAQLRPEPSGKGIFGGTDDFHAYLSTYFSYLDLDGDFRKFREDRELGREGSTGNLERFRILKERPDGYYLEFDSSFFDIARAGHAIAEVGKRGLFAFRSGYIQYDRFYDDSTGRPYALFPARFELGRDLFITNRDFFVEAEFKLGRFPKVKLGYRRTDEQGDILLLKGSPVGGVLSFLFPTPKEIDSETNHYYLETSHTFGRFHTESRWSYRTFDYSQKLTETAFTASDIDRTIEFRDDYDSKVFLSTSRVGFYATRNFYITTGLSFQHAEVDPDSRRFFDNRRFVDFLRRLEAADAERERLAFTAGAVYRPLSKLVIRGKYYVADTEENGFARELTFRVRRGDAADLIQTRLSDTDDEKTTHVAGVDAAYYGIRKMVIRGGYELEASNEDLHFALLALGQGALDARRIEEVDRTKQTAFLKAKYRPYRWLTLNASYTIVRDDLDKDFPVARNFFILDDTQRDTDTFSAEVRYSPKNYLQLGAKFDDISRDYTLEPLPGSETELDLNQLTYFFDFRPDSKLSLFGLVSTARRDNQIVPPILIDLRNFSPVEFAESTTTYGINASYVATKRLSLSADFYETVARESVSYNNRTTSFSLNYALRPNYIITASYHYFSFDEKVFDNDDYTGNLLLLGFKARL